MSQTVTWDRAMTSLGRAVVAIGVFDGVHAGHRDLLEAAVGRARHHGCLCIALTFDRDPDHVLHPQAATPALLTLEQRVAALATTGVDIVLVVPFTSELATTPATGFLDAVLGVCCRPVEVHVGRDFRFGAHASGDLDTLYVWGVEHGVEIRPRDLLEVDGLPVTSTRIRTLIAAGDVAGAARLLGTPPSVVGSVHRGRGAGSAIGFATANVVPTAHAALPADGVYAGSAVLGDGSVWPAAISVGTPPSFPEARDYVEAHLLDFEGDLYEQVITLGFVQRLRDQRAFTDIGGLSAAIAADIAMVRELFSPAPLSGAVELEGDPLVDDPVALEAAERSVANLPAEPAYVGFDSTWECVLGPVRLATLFKSGGANAALITGPLADAGIPFVWDPFPPDRISSARPDLNWQREFRLLVAPGHAQAARALLGE